MAERDASCIHRASGRARIRDVDPLQVEPQPQPIGLFATQFAQIAVFKTLDDSIPVPFRFTVANQHQSLHSSRPNCLVAKTSFHTIAVPHDVSYYNKQTRSDEM